MNQTERRIFLIRELLKEDPRYGNVPVPEDTQEQKNLLRSLMNVRPPRPAGEAFLAVQDAYLKEAVAEKGIVRPGEIPEIRRGISLWQGDITRLAADAIVNAANSRMLGCFVPMHTCIDNCIHTFAGVQLRLACHAQMEALRARYGADYEQPTAVPMLTPGCNLPANHVIHIVGPIVSRGLTPALEADLAACYRNALELCRENGLKTVAFCCISTGVFRFPNDRAARIAVDTVSRWREEHPGVLDRVIFNVFKDEDRRLYEKELS